MRKLKLRKFKLAVPNSTLKSSEELCGGKSDSLLPDLLTQTLWAAGVRSEGGGAA